MTEEHNAGPQARIDLRTLDLGENSAREDQVMRAVMQRITSASTRPDTWESIARMQRRLAAIAAMLLLMAGAVLFAQREQRNSELTDLIENWVASNHIPTNGELLAAYKGYRR